MNRASNDKIVQAAFLLVCSLGFARAAVAEPPKGGADAALQQTLRKAQGMLRQLSQEKAELEAKSQALENKASALEQNVKDLEAKISQLEPLKGQLQQAKTSLATQQQTNDSLRRQIGDQTSRLEAMSAAQHRTTDDLGRQRQDNRLLVDAVKERTRWIQECTGKNAGLVKTTKEIVENLGNRSFWDQFGDAEPFTGIAGVTKENAMQEFKFKLEDLQVTPWREEAKAPPSVNATPAPQAEGSAEAEDGETEDASPTAEPQPSR